MTHTKNYTQTTELDSTRNDIRPYSKYLEPYAHENQIDRMIIY